MEDGVGQKRLTASGLVVRDSQRRAGEGVPVFRNDFEVGRASAREKRREKERGEEDPHDVGQHPFVWPCCPTNGIMHVTETCQILTAAEDMLSRCYSQCQILIQSWRIWYVAARKNSRSVLTNLSI